MTVMGPTSLEHVAFAPVFSHAGVPQAAIDAMWEAGFFSDWQADAPLPAAPSAAVADELVKRDASLRALGASMRDEQWLDSLAHSTLQPAWEGLALNPMLPASARDHLAKRKASQSLVTARVDADAAWASHVPSADPTDVIEQLIDAREAHTIASILTGTDTAAAEAVMKALTDANGGPTGANARVVRHAVALLSGTAIVEATARSSRGVIDVTIVPMIAELIDAGTLSADDIEARLHHDARGLARRLGGPLAVLAPRRAREPMSKEAEDVLDQFEVLSLIDPTSAARRAMFWWASLSDSDVSRLLDAADIETVVDWCQGTLQVAPDDSEVIELLSTMNGTRFEEFLDEVSRRPDPSEEHPVLAIATREPLRAEWRVEGVDATAAYLCSKLTTDDEWRTAFKLFANGWTRSIWELGECAAQV